MTDNPFVLAGDLGGTNTRLRISDGSGARLERHYGTRDFPTLAPLVQAFLEEWDQPRPARACFAVAGPVAPAGDSARVTALQWELDRGQLSGELGIERVQLANDFAAVAHGVPVLTGDQFVTLQDRPAAAGAVKALIGAGTGLGQALLLEATDGPRVIATEGGHADFAPRGKQQIALLRFMEQQFDHVSFERLISGPGLVQIYRFLTMQWDTKPAIDLEAKDAAANISRLAREQQDGVANSALDLFVSLYGAQAGNLALTTMALGGVYLAGGIAPRLLDKLQGDSFRLAFQAKGRMSPLMDRFPVHVITEPLAGLAGATELARRL